MSDDKIKEKADIRSNLIHLLFADTICFWNAQIAEYLRAAVFWRKVGHAGNDVEMHVGVLQSFGKLNRVGFAATRCHLQALRNMTNQNAKF